MDIERKLDRRSLLKLGAGTGLAVALAQVGLGQPGRAEASATPEDLPAHIIYFEEAAVEYRRASHPSVVLRRKGDILLLMSQRIRVMGNVWNIDPENHPERTQVIAIANQGTSSVGIEYQTFDGIFARQDREKTPRIDRSLLIDDVITANLVQVSRSRIPGNCVASGCAATRVVTALAFDQNGAAVFELLTDYLDTR